jgi:hypothetical protein
VAKVFRGSFTQEQNELFKRVFVELAAALGASETVLADAYERPVPDSANGKARQANLWDAYEQAGLLIYSAEDHLRTILWLFEGGRLPTYSLYTLLRGAAVPVVKCAYLLESGIDEKSRLARALNVRWEGQEEQNKLDPNSQRFAERIQYLEDRAVLNGIPVFKKDPERPATDFGERRLSELALFGRFLKGRDPASRFGEMMYRFLSGHVHAEVWVKMVNAEVSATGDSGIASVKLDLNFDWFATMFRLVLRLHVVNLTSLLTLSGYPGLVWDQSLRTATERARARYVELATEQAAEGSKKPESGAP